MAVCHLAIATADGRKPDKCWQNLAEIGKVSEVGRPSVQTSIFLFSQNFECLAGVVFSAVWIGGYFAMIKTGDLITLDVPNRKMNVNKTQRRNVSMIKVYDLWALTQANLTPMLLGEAIVPTARDSEHSSGGFAVVKTDSSG